MALVCSYLATWINPETFWPPAFFGLSYPLWFLSNALFAIWWLYRRKRKRFLLPLLVILLGFNHHTDYFQINLSGSADHEDKAQVKILSYNVRLFDYYNFKGNKETRNQIFDVLEREDADIICFQEFYHTDREGHFTTRDSLLQFLRPKNVHEKYTHHMRGQQYFGVVTLSAWPVVNRGSIPFENDPNNFCIYTDLKINEDTIRVYNAHLASIRFDHHDYAFVNDLRQGQGSDVSTRSRRIASRLRLAFWKRATQTRLILDHVTTSPFPVVVCGDFNDTPVSYCYRQFASKLEDAFTESGNGIGATYIGDFPSFRIDYIFHDDALHSYDFKVLPEELSDHHGITCTLEVGTE